MADRVSFRGGLTCSCVVETFPLVEQEMLLRGLISDSIDVFQWGWRTDVGASAGTHSKAGVLDTGQFSDDQLHIWRSWGFECQHRTRAQGFAIAHGHAVLKGCPHTSSQARGQANAWENGRNGLVSNGPITGPGPKGTDTPTWQKAIRERKAVLVTLKEDIAAEVVKQVVKELRKDYPKIADTVLERDVIDNTFTGNEANKTVNAKTAFTYLGRRAAADLGDNADIRGLLTEILTRLPKETPK